MSSSRPTGGADHALPEAVKSAVNAALDKKAVDVTVLDLRTTGAFADFFVICSGQNTRQVKAILEAVEEALKRDGLRPSHVEGDERCEWVLLDYFDLIIHVFVPELRAFYGLERLWGRAVQIDIGADGQPLVRAHHRSASQSD
jgi:ribosome-associated protein